jgi:hypothetical protein
LSLAFSAPAVGGTLDDCGYLFRTYDGCLLFAPDNHAGHYQLSEYGEFDVGARVHVSGEHNASAFGSCNDSFIQNNSISEGCSQLCSGQPFDANNDTRTNIGDLAMVVSYIFTGYHTVTCLEQADCNNNGRIEISDVTCMFDALYNN